jgi:hypothetical protein
VPTTTPARRIPQWAVKLLRYLLAALVGAAVAAAGSLAFLAASDALYRQPSRDPSEAIGKGLAYVILPVLAAPIGALVGVVAVAVWPLIKKRRGRG